MRVGALQVTKHHSHSFLTALLGTKPERGDGLGIALSPKCLPARGDGSKGKWWQAKQVSNGRSRHNSGL